MSYFGNTPSWVYKQEIDNLKAAGHMTDRMNKEQITKSIEKVLSVVDYSIISIWCDLNGYYYPIKKDFEKLEQIDNLEKQIKEMQVVGISQREISKRLGISKGDIEAWWHKTEKDFFRVEQAKEKYLDNYKSFILDLLKMTP